MNNKENLIVVIPAYEPPPEFSEYAKSVAERVKRLVVVNDGSGEEYEMTFESIKALPNVSYISYGENHGKGYALKTALRYCLDNFKKDDIIVTADCDGQHRIKDIFGVFEAASTHPDALMLGSRDFNSPNVPRRSRSGNTKIRALFRIFYGINLYDTQTGLRGFSVATAERFLKVKGDRFEFEMSMLIFAKKHGIKIFETPIDTVYPENPEEHMSHFKTFSDSMRVLSVVLGNFSLYIFVVLLSGIVDIGVFFVLSSLVFPEISALYTLIATVAARVSSSLLNFMLNYKYVFGGASKKSIFKYYILWFCQMGASYGIVFLFGNVIGLHLTATKAVGDMLLGILSYQIQQYWVFKGKNKENFYTPTASMLKPVARFFSKEYRCNVLPYAEGAVYVARHLNMHGPMTCLKWLDFCTHPMVFSPFFTKRDCYIQYRDYTFSERYGKKKFNFKAFVASRFVPKMVNSVKAIPVYRNSIKVSKTFRASVECLMKGESIIVFPDTEYTNEGESVSEIYKGFLYIGELYKRKSGKSLRFVPIYIDDEKRSLNEGKHVFCDKFSEDSERASLEIKYAINGTPLPSENTDAAAPCPV